MGKNRRSKKKGKATECLLKEVNERAAGIDIGSEEHYVSVPVELDSESVRSFAATTPHLHEMAQWLKSIGVTSIVMEATGIYWIPVWQLLSDYGFKLVLADPRKVKGIGGRKSDVLDCQWLQALHSHGLIQSAFVPDNDTLALRDYWRLRSEHVRNAAQQLMLMQKALDSMNLKLHKVLSDIAGQSGMRIIRAIVEGERNPLILAPLVDSRVKASQQEFVDALTGEYREQHVFALKQALEMFETFHEKIMQCDEQMQKHMSKLLEDFDIQEVNQPKAVKGSRRKNQLHGNLDNILAALARVDLTRIDGIGSLTAMTAVAECGLDLSAFPSEKHFASWLGLCPNNRITGGAVKSRRTRKVSHPLATALRLGAQTLERSQTALGSFFRRIKARAGRPKAITATANKLAKLIYRAMRFGMQYVDEGIEKYEARFKQRKLAYLVKQAREFGFQLTAAVA